MTAAARTAAVTLSPFSFLPSHFVLRDPGFDQLPYQGRRQGLVRRKAYGPPAGVVALEVLLERCHRGGTHGVERAVGRPRAEGHQGLSVQPERGELVADALLRL